MYNAPRAATLTAKTDCKLWVLDRETFNLIVKDSWHRKRELYQNFIKTVPILSEIDIYEASQIADALKPLYYRKDDHIIKEGELGDIFYIVLEGEAVASKVIEAGKIFCRN